MTTTLMKGQLQAFGEHGFLAIPRALPGEKVATASAAVDEIIRSASHVFGRCESCGGVHPDFEVSCCDARDVPFVQLFNVWADHRALRALSLGAALRALAEQILCVRETRLLLDQLLVKRPGDGATPPHVDAYHWPLDRRVLTFWIPLQPVEAKMGAMRYYAGTHRRPHSQSQLAGISSENAGTYTGEWLAAEDWPATTVGEGFVPGDICVHDGWTAHEAEPNHSKTPRAVLVAHVADAQVRMTECVNAAQLEQAKLFQWSMVPPGRVLRTPGTPVQ